MSQRMKSSTVGAAVFAILLLAAVAGAAGPYTYYPVAPCRVVDTREPNEPLRQGGILTGGWQRDFTIKGRCGVPTVAKAITLNLTIVSPTLDGFVSLWPTGGVFPVVSTINFVAYEQALANGAITPLAAGTPDLAAIYGNAVGPGSGTIHVIIDVTGYFQ